MISVYNECIVFVRFHGNFIHTKCILKSNLVILYSKNGIMIHIFPFQKRSSLWWNEKERVPQKGKKRIFSWCTDSKRMQRGGGGVHFILLHFNVFMHFCIRMNQSSQWTRFVDVVICACVFSFSFQIVQILSECKVLLSFRWIQFFFRAASVLILLYSVLHLRLAPYTWNQRK